MKIPALLFAILMFAGGGAAAAVLSHAPLPADEAVHAGVGSLPAREAAELRFIEVGIISPYQDLETQRERIRLAMNGQFEDCEEH